MKSLIRTKRALGAFTFISMLVLTTTSIQAVEVKKLLETAKGIEKMSWDPDLDRNTKNLNSKQLTTIKRTLQGAKALEFGKLYNEKQRAKILEDIDKTLDRIQKSPAEIAAESRAIKRASVQRQAGERKRAAAQRQGKKRRDESLRRERQRKAERREEEDRTVARYGTTEEKKNYKSNTRSIDYHQREIERVQTAQRKGTSINKFTNQSIVPVSWKTYKTYDELLEVIRSEIAKSEHSNKLIVSKIMAETEERMRKEKESIKRAIERARRVLEQRRGVKSPY